jgi:hypothetical protein
VRRSDTPDADVTSRAKGKTAPRWRGAGSSPRMAGTSSARRQQEGLASAEVKYNPLARRAAGLKSRQDATCRSSEDDEDDEPVSRSVRAVARWWCQNATLSLTHDAPCPCARRLRCARTTPTDATHTRRVWRDSHATAASPARTTVTALEPEATLPSTRSNPHPASSRVHASATRHP